MLIDIIEAHHRLGLHPPVSVVIDMSCVDVRLVCHRAVVIQPFLRSLRHESHYGLHLLQHVVVSEHYGGLVHEPRAFYVVSVALEPSCASCPVHLEEEVEVVCLGVENLVREDVDEVSQRHLHLRLVVDVHLFAGLLHLFQASEEVGVWLNNMQVCVLRFGIVCVEFRQPHVRNLSPLSCLRLDISVIYNVERVVFYDIEEVEAELQRFLLLLFCHTAVVHRRPDIFAHAVEHETDGIELFLRVRRPAVVCH